MIGYVAIDKAKSDIVMAPLDAISGANLDTFHVIDVDCMVPLHLGMVFSRRQANLGLD